MLRLILIVVMMVFSELMFAQNWVEERTYISDGHATPRIDGLMTRPIKGRLGSFVWFQTQKGYSQTYAGATYSPKPWVQFALGGGLEEAKNPARVGGYVWLGNAKTSILFVPEYGGSGFWWKLEVNRKVNKSIGVGLITDPLTGSGPRVEYQIPKIRLTFWLAPLTRANTLIGIRWSL